MGSEVGKWIAIGVLIPTLIIIGIVAKDFSNQVRYDMNQQYFFMHDPDFFTSSDCLAFHWDTRIWNEHDESYANTTSGYALLQYNETTGEDWGASILQQGLLPHSKGGYKKLLVGSSLSNAEEEAGCVFHKDFPVENFNLKVKVMVTNLSYVCNVTGDIPKANIGFEFVCSYTYRNDDGELCDAPFDNPDVNVTGNIKIGIYFMQAEWNFTGSTFNHISPPYEYYFKTNAYDDDYHLVLTRGEVLDDIDVWHTFSIDIQEVLWRSFHILNYHGARIETIIVKGVQLYVEGTGTSVGAKFDYVKTELGE